MEKRCPQFLTEDSPSVQIGGKADQRYLPVIHPRPLLSLDNAFSREDVLAFFARVKKSSGLENLGYLVEQKMDGLSVEVQYRDGALAIAATRGDGLTGENITANIRTIGSLPQNLKDKLPFLATRGEVYMPKEAFKNLNLEREENGEMTFANPRNAAAGSLRQLDAEITAQRKLEIFVYDILSSDGKNLPNQRELLAYLKSQGFPVNPHNFFSHDEEEILAYIDQWQEKRHGLPYDTDGMVIKLDDLRIREEIGSTNRAPRWAMAYKFPPEEAQTRILEIKVGVGRTGAMTPLAILEPVLLAGSTISRATLHNEDNILEKDLRIGDTVIIHKAGDV
ncbi:MAG: NAD-dependent DNA ligase LigA, partial [Clostridiales bacterium]